MKMLAHRILIARNFIAQDKYFVDKKFVKIISSLEKHILRKLKFDEDDIFWVKKVVGSFIILLYLQIEGKEESIENYADLI